MRRSRRISSLCGAKDMNNKNTISAARDRLGRLQATAEHAIRSQNRHRILLVFLFSIAVLLLIGFLVMEIFAGQANFAKNSGTGVNFAEEAITPPKPAADSTNDDIEGVSPKPTTESTAVVASIAQNRQNPSELSPTRTP